MCVLLGFLENENEHRFSVVDYNGGWQVLGNVGLESYDLTINRYLQITEYDTNLSEEMIDKVKFNLIKNIFHGNYNGVDVIE